MKRIILILAFIFPTLLFAQKYAVENMPVCWNVNGVDSSITRYILASARGTTIKVLTHLNASAQKVNVIGGTLTNGYCECQNNGGTGGPDGDWGFVSGNTILDPVYRNGHTNIFTQANTHGFRVDSTFQFRMDGAQSIFDWQDGNNETRFKGLLLRGDGGSKIDNYLEDQDNSIVVGRTNQVTIAQRLGAFGFSSLDTSINLLRIGAIIDAVASENWTVGNTPTELQFYTTALQDTTPEIRLTIRDTGRISFNDYINFEDGIPERLIGNLNTNHNTTVHTISGTPGAGKMIGINGAADGLEWKDSSAFMQEVIIPVANVAAIAAYPAVMNGTKFHDTGTGASFLAQASAVSGYTTDGVAVVLLTGGNFAVLESVSGRILLSHFGIVYGSICTDIGCTNTTQATTNYTLYKKAHVFAEIYGLELLVDGQTLELMPAASNSISTTDMKIIGLSKETTTVDFFPKNKTYVVHVYELNDGAKWKSKDINFTATPFQLETYNSIANVAGDATKVQITDATIRVGIADIVGKNIYVSKNNQTISEAFTVSSYDVGTKTITLSGSLSGTFASDEVSSVGIEFAGTTSLSDFTSFGQKWRDENREYFLVNYLNEGNLDVGSIDFIDSKSSGFDYVLFRSGGAYTINVDNSYVSGNVVGISSFSGTSAINSSVLLHRSEMSLNGFLAVGYLPGNVLSALGIYGAGGYIHPNVQVQADYIDFYDNIAVAWRQYSSTGDKPVNIEWSSKYTNCRWWNNIDLYNLYTSESMPTKIVLCEFKDNNIYVNNRNEFVNCTIDNVQIPVRSDSTTLKFTDCNFINSSYISSGLHTEVYVDITNSEIELGATYTLDLVNIEKLSLSNTTITGSGTLINYTPPYTTRLINVDMRSGTVFKRLTITDFYSKYSIEIKDSYIYSVGDLNQISTFPSKLLKIENSEFGLGAFGQVVIGITPLGLSKYPTTVSATTKSFTAPAYASASTIELNPNYNSFDIDGSFDRAIFSIQKLNGEHRGSSFFDGVVSITAINNITISQYNSSTNQLSNFTFDDFIPTGETRRYRYNSNTVLSSGITSGFSENLGTTGTGTSYTKWEKMTNWDLVIGSVVVTIGTVVLTDNGDGTLDAPDGSQGVISYTDNTLYIKLANAPTSGTNIDVAYDYYAAKNYQGAWEQLSISDTIALKPQSGTGTPVSIITPRYLGDVYVDTTGASEVIWQSYGTANTNWLQISN